MRHLLFFLTTLLFSISLNAQNIFWIGNGNYETEYPLYTTYGTQKATTVIIKKEEIFASGGTAGYISEIRLFLSSPANTDITLSVEIGNTNASTAASAYFSEGIMSTAKTISTGTQGELSIPFNGNFYWSGSKNLLIRFCPQVATPGSASMVRATSVSGRASRPALNNCYSESTVLLNYRPNIGILMGNSSFTGFVYDSVTHAPIPGVKIFFPRTESLPGNPSVSEWTTPDGAFAFGNIPSGQNEVRIQKPGYEDLTISLNFSNGQPITHNFTMLESTPPCSFGYAALSPDQAEVRTRWRSPEKEVEFIYDDGTAESYITMEPGKRYAVFFDSLISNEKITPTKISMFSYDNYYPECYVDLIPIDKSTGLPATPFLQPELFIVGIEKWHSIMLTNSYNKFDSDYCVAMKAAANNTVKIGVDHSSSGRSYIYDDINGWQPYSGGNFLIRATCNTNDLHPLPGGSGPVGPVSFEYYRLKQGDEGFPALYTFLGESDTLVFTDTTWPQLTDGGYRWVNRVIYSMGRKSEIIFSPVVGKNWDDSVTFIINRGCNSDTSDFYILACNIDVVDSCYYGISSGNQVTFPKVWNGKYRLFAYSNNYGMIADTFSVYSDKIVNLFPQLLKPSPGELKIDTATTRLAWKIQPIYLDTILLVNFNTGSWPASCLGHGANWSIEQSGQDSLSARFSWTPQLTDYESRIKFLIENPDGSPNINKIRISYDIKLDNYATTNENTMAVEINGNYSSPLASYSNLNGSFGWRHESIITDYEYHTYDLSFVARGVNSYDINYWYIDNIFIDAFYVDMSPCFGGYNVSLDGNYILTTQDTSCILPSSLLAYGTEHTATVCAMYPGDSACASLTFTSGYLPPVDQAWATATEGTGYIGWIPPPLLSGSTLNKIGYEVVRNDSLISFTDPSAIGYTDEVIPDTALIYGVTVCYNTSPGGDTLRSDMVLCDTVQNSDALAIPFLEDWSSMSFEDNNWVFDPAQGNWSITPTYGKSGFCAAFNGTPVFNDYSYALVSPYFTASRFDCADILLSFDLKLLSNGSTENYLDIDINAGGQWIPLHQYQAQGSFEWTPVSTDITLWYNQPFRLRFRAWGNNSSLLGSWMIDNIRIDPVCKAASGLTLNQKTDGLTLNWYSPECLAGKSQPLFIHTWNGIPTETRVNEASIPLTSTVENKLSSLKLYNAGRGKSENYSLIVSSSEDIAIQDTINITAPISEGWIEINPSHGTEWLVNGKLALKAIPIGETTGLMTLSSDSNVIILAGISGQSMLPDNNSIWKSADDEIRSVIGYNVYRDGELITTSPVADTFYFDAPGFDQVHYYTVSAIHDGDCESDMSNEVLSDITIGYREQNADFYLNVSPNPANQYTEIKWQIAEEQDARLSLVSTLGNEVFFKELRQSSGVLKLNTSTISSGVYILRLKTNAGTTFIKKLTITR